MKMRTWNLNPTEKSFQVALINKLKTKASCNSLQIMKQKKDYSPDWENSESWEEIEWEKALKFSDNLASSYFHMLERFSDLPYAEELIATKLGDQNLIQYEDFFLESEWNFESTEDHIDDELVDSIDFSEKPEPGDLLFFESSPAYQKARQIALGWCNVIASVLRPDDQFSGIKVLFLMGRLLSYLSLSIADGTFEHINGNISFAKRALNQINSIIGELDKLEKESSRYSTVFTIVRDHLLENHDLVIDYLLGCKKRQKDDNKS
jgi:hypothetical protein